MNRKHLLVMGVALLSAILISISFRNTTQELSDLANLVESKPSLVHQDVIAHSDTPIEITQLYRNDMLIGTISNEKHFDDMFNAVYHAEYEEEYPNSKLSFMDDLIRVKTLSVNQYENKDKEIFEYLHKENLFAIEVDKVEFSNGAIIYVKESSEFEKARDHFILNFTNEETFNALKNNTNIKPLTDYGVQDINVQVEETVKITKGLASKDQILKNESEILTFLSYGYEPEIELYTVKEYDTIPGIAWHHGMDPKQIVYINSDTLTSVDQILRPGSTLRVSKFNSPFSVTVTRERRVSEPIIPESTIYESDPNLEEGKEIVDVVEKNGTRDVVYIDTILNGAPKSSEEKLSKVLEEPVRGKIRYGTKIEPRIGSGNYRWPLDNANISCVYGNSCYLNHHGTDFVQNGGGFGPIYAVDRGVVSETHGGCGTGDYYCGGGWGNYIIIDHGNGYESLYAHMVSAPYFNVGDLVKRGDNIGYMGMSGRTYGPHVHLEIRYYGIKIDPCSVMGC